MKMIWKMGFASSENLRFSLSCSCSNLITPSGLSQGTCLQIIMVNNGSKKLTRVGQVKGLSWEEPKKKELYGLISHNNKELLYGLVVPKVRKKSERTGPKKSDLFLWETSKSPKNYHTLMMTLLERLELWKIFFPKWTLKIFPSQIQPQKIYFWMIIQVTFRNSKFLVITIMKNVFQKPTKIFWEPKEEESS